MKPKNRELVELTMDAVEFDRVMRGALAVPPPKRKPKQRIRRNTKSKPGKS